MDHGISPAHLAVETEDAEKLQGHGGIILFRRELDGYLRMLCPLTC
ncbi:hypothetical protein [Nonomuraea sp. NPDC050691]